MKKITAIVLLLAMALCLCACGDNNKEARFVGTWEGTNISGEAFTLTLNADGTATCKVTGESTATYEFAWTAETVYTITLKWTGEPIPAEVEETSEETTEAVEETVDTEIPEETTGEVVEETTAEVIEETTAEVVEETAAAADDAATSTTGTTRKVDPSLVGTGSFTVAQGEMYLNFAEGSSTDILLFQCTLKKVA